jgi:hypothetical protein
MVQNYLDLSREAIQHQLVEISSRHPAVSGQRQGPFNAVETLLCYGLFPQLFSPALTALLFVVLLGENDGIPCMDFLDQLFCD